VSVGVTRLAITMGDPCGIGPEIVLKTLADAEARGRAQHLVVGDLGLLERTARLCGLSVSLEPASALDWVSAGGSIPVLDTGGAAADLVPGEASAAGGEAAWRAIEAAVGVCSAGGADALVTAPINKVALSLSGRGSHGHTELLQELTGSPWSLTVFLLDSLRAVYYSRHLSLRDAIDAVRAEPLADLLVRFKEVAPALGLSDPLVGVAALNPHGGEGGLFGREELDEIGPGIELARTRGVRVEGPIPADSIFHLAQSGRFDAVVGLYHDQVAAVLKSIAFERVVSVTLGLTFLRFSLDHGTAYDIAGRNAADARNMAAVLEAADRIVRAGRAVEATR
jgi:4-hydroxythreonine-4-phosphate dehydrogenase